MVYIVFHLEPLFEELVKVVDFASRYQYEVNEWYDFCRDPNKHYYRTWIEPKDEESYLKKFGNNEEE